jgi:ABC-2 type transport system permease protein
MAVYKQTYKRYDGVLTRERWRFAVLARYSFLAIFESRLLAVFYTVCFVPLFLAGALIYVHHSTRAMMAMDLGNGFRAIPIDSVFFNILFRVQAFLTFILVAFIGPSLVTSDVANNALPIYMSKPFSRGEYVSGRITVLFALTSAITWLPCWILVGLQTDMAGLGWLGANYRIPGALFVSSWIWIISVSLMALAFSAWLKWKPLAAGAMLGVFFAPAGLGTMLNALLPSNKQWGLLLNLSSIISMIFDWMNEGFAQDGEVPAWLGLIVMGLVAGASVWVLRRRIRASEVVR